MVVRNSMLGILLAGATLAGPGLSVASAIEVVPHQAIYRLSLASGARSMSVVGVDGQMLFQWGDSCDGWTVEQRYLMRFTYSQGEQIELSSTYTTWESKDGLTFNFNLRSETDGQVDEEIRGNASLESVGGPGEAEFRMPEENVLRLPAGTIFPTAHTLALYQQAEAGTRLFSAQLFDGTETDGVTEVSAALGDRQPAAGEPAFPLLASPSWPVAMAFFSPAPDPADPDPADSDPASAADEAAAEAARAGLPQYQMAVRLHENGIAGDMVIDYGDFAVRATLVELAPLETGDC